MNSKKQKSKRRRTVEAKSEMLDGHNLIKELPVDAKPTLARLGMVVQGLNAGEYGTIVGMTKGFAIVRFPGGKESPMAWCEVSLDHVRPDPSQLAHLAGRELTGGNHRPVG